MWATAVVMQLAYATDINSIKKQCNIWKTQIPECNNTWLYLTKNSCSNTPIPKTARKSLFCLQKCEGFRVTLQQIFSLKEEGFPVKSAQAHHPPGSQMVVASLEHPKCINKVSPPQLQRTTRCFFYPWTLDLELCTGWSANPVELQRKKKKKRAMEEEHTYRDLGGNWRRRTDRNEWAWPVPRMA